MTKSESKKTSFQRFHFSRFVCSVGGGSFALSLSRSRVVYCLFFSLLISHRSVSNYYFGVCVLINPHSRFNLLIPQLLYVVFFSSPPYFMPLNSHSVIFRFSIMPFFFHFASLPFHLVCLHTVYVPSLFRLHIQLNVRAEIENACNAQIRRSGEKKTRNIEFKRK